MAPRPLIDTIASRRNSNQAKDLVNTLDVPRTEVQIRPHDGFKPEAIVVRDVGLVSAASRTMQLARPPGFTEADLPCLPHPDIARHKNMARAHMDQWDTANEAKAKELCGECPVRDECLADAMEFEGEYDGRNRYLVRGGETPWGRSRLAGNFRRVHIQECEHCEWAGEKRNQHMKRKHPELLPQTGSAGPH